MASVWSQTWEGSLPASFWWPGIHGVRPGTARKINMEPPPWAHHSQGSVLGLGALWADPWHHNTGSLAVECQLSGWEGTRAGGTVPTTYSWTHLHSALVLEKKTPGKGQRGSELLMVRGPGWVWQYSQAHGWTPLCKSFPQANLWVTESNSLTVGRDCEQELKVPSLSLLVSSCKGHWPGTAGGLQRSREDWWRNLDGDDWE